MLLPRQESWTSYSYQSLGPRCSSCGYLALRSGIRNVMYDTRPRCMRSSQVRIGSVGRVRHLNAACVRIAALPRSANCRLDVCHVA